MNKLVKDIKKDALIFFIYVAILFLISGTFDIFEKVSVVVAKYEDYELDEIIITAFFSCFLLVLFLAKQVRYSLKTVVKLEAAKREIKQLKSLLSICSTCKKIKNEDSTWSTFEEYVTANTDSDFTHGICPECIKKYYPRSQKNLKDNPNCIH